MESAQPATYNPNPIPFYRTRWFWGVVIGAMIVWGLVHYFLFIHNDTTTISGTLLQISLSMGALPTVVILDGVIGEVLSFFVYYIVIIILLYKTFSKKNVSLIYPVVFSLIFVTGHIARIFLSGVI